MTNDEMTNVALFRYGLIAELISGKCEERSLNEAFEKISGKGPFTVNGESVSPSPSTLERWYYTYKNYGFDALKPNPRNDNGRSRKIDDEIKEVVTHYLEEHPRMPATAIYEALLSNHYITRQDVSLSTITRMVKRLKKSMNIITRSEMKRYEMPGINDVWCCDTTYSYKLTVNGEKKQTFIIAIIDDASRMVVGCDVFFNDNYVNFLSVLKEAIRKCGKPKCLNLDNGGTYKNKQLNILAARIGISLFHNKPYYGQGKAKVERWFRTMKDHFMASYTLTNKTTLEEYREALKKYVVEYNNAIHSSLNGISPITRFYDSGEIPLYLDESLIEQYFLLEVERKATADCVIQLDNIQFEVPASYSNRSVTIRYSSDYSICYLVEPDDTLTPINRLDKIANSKMKRKQPVFNVEENA